MTRGKPMGGLGIPGNTGFPWMAVRVTSVDGDIAQVIDSHGGQRQISVKTRRGGGPRPRVGERWAIDRTLGFWTFATVLEPKPHHVKGSNGNIPALVDLLTWMEKAGLIVDDSTSDPMVAAHPHTHIAPNGGGVTTADTPPTQPPPTLPLNP